MELIVALNDSNYVKFFKCLTDADPDTLGTATAEDRAGAGVGVGGGGGVGGGVGVGVGVPLVPRARLVLMLSLLQGLVPRVRVEALETMNRAFHKTEQVPLDELTAMLRFKGRWNRTPLLSRCRRHRPPTVPFG